MRHMCIHIDKDIHMDIDMEHIIAHKIFIQTYIMKHCVNVDYEIVYT